ncbi:MAG: SdrD B-like domain-containing protein [Hydrogenophaga sp.]|uniref:SdrD B-like domain-containing protein n=1 Tax=Hydrogenophaga sp. TaxID=1904254 RepID=UPI003D9BBC8A
MTTTLAPVTLAPGQTVSSAPITVPLTTTGATVTALVGTSTVPDSNPANNTDTENGAALPPSASISGSVYYDLDRDRLYDIGEQRLPGYQVQLLQVTGSSTVVVGSATTGANGQYTITGLYPGSGYQLRFLDPLGNVVIGTPYNQAATTLNGQPSTGVTVAATSPMAGTVSGVIQGITLYDGDNTIEQNLPIDPQGVIYDAISRQPVGGVTVQLNGPVGFVPSTHLLGGTNTVVTDAVSGVYQFLFVNSPPPGVYSLSIVSTPVGYKTSTAVLGGVAPPQGTLIVPGGVITNIQPQGTAPAVGVDGLPGTLYYTSFSYDFTAPGEIFNNHIPLDPVSSPVVSKVGDKNVAEVGDSMRYTIRITNGVVPASTVTVADMLPAGFRYIPGTARLGGAALPDPAGAGTRSLNFSIGAMAANAQVELTYFVRLGVGSQQGDGTNRATAIFTTAGGTVRSNTAAFKVNVQGGVFSNEGCIVGTVYSDCDGNHVQNNAGGSREIGIPGVRLVMLDGSYVITDAEGKYSVCGVKPQTHVIKVDRKTLPLGARLLPSSNRNAGDGNSIFVDMKGGEMARADFVEGSCSPQVLDQVKARRAQGGDASPEAEKGPVYRIQPGGESPLQQIMPATRQNGANATGGAAQ